MPLRSFLPIRLCVVFACVVVIKCVLNLSDALYLKRMKAQYMSWLKGSFSDVKALLRSKERVIRLIKDAGVENPHLPITQPMGYMQFASFYASIFDNYPSRAYDFAGLMLQSFESAIGVYYGRMKDSVNPLYWLKFFVYLPTRILGALGLDKKSVLSKVVQFIYWILIASVLAVYPMVQKPIANWLRSIADRMG